LSDKALDTITGGAGSDVVSYDTASTTANIVTQGAVTTVSFGNGTVTQVSNVETLHFTDKDIHLP
jgi:hypothetical protein